MFFHWCENLKTRKKILIQVQEFAQKREAMTQRVHPTNERMSALVFMELDRQGE